MASSADWESLAVELAGMARELLDEESVQATVDTIVARAVDLVDDCAAAGVLVLRQGRVVTLSATDNVVRASDRMQDELGEGPCFDAAYRKEETYRVADMSRSEPRWPRFAPQARELGVGSMMGFLLFTHGDDDLGALDLYSSRPGAFTETSARAGWVVASHAAVALSNSRTHAQLWEAVESRQNIGQALGILRERHNLGEQEAFEHLRRVSQHRNVKMHELAETVNRTGEVPGAPDT